MTNNNNFYEKLVLVFLCLIAICYPIFTAIGIYKSYTGVPFWDSWSILSMQEDFEKGNFSVLFKQHNEHRIFLSRLLFSADLYWFGGKFIFLLTLNFFLPLLSLVTFWKFIDSNGDESSKNLRIVVKSITLALLFSWIQWENFVWEFESQFFLAQILPLICFFFLYKSTENQEKSKLFFFHSCLFGVLSLGTMANGALALPFATILAVTLGLSWRRTLVLFLLSIAGCYAYFYNFHSLPHHGSLTKTLITDPIGLIHYALSYLGSPISYLVSPENRATSFIIPTFGFVMVATSLFFVINILRNWKNRSKLELSLLFFVFYVEILSVITGGGRLLFGIEQSLSSRYSTPVLMAWICIVILLFKHFETYLKKHILKLALASSLTLFGLLFSNQKSAIKTPYNINFSRMMAAVALEMGVKDEKQTFAVYPNNWVSDSAPSWREKDLTIFNHPLIKDVNKIIGTKLDEELPQENCLGHTDEILKIEGDSNYFAVTGWIYNSSAKEAPQKIFVLNDKNEIIGYGLTGALRKDVKEALHERKARTSGFKIYFLNNKANNQITLKGEHPNCKMTIDLQKINHLKR